MSTTYRLPSGPFVHGAEAFVGRREELGLVVRRLRRQRSLVVDEDSPRHEIAGRLADEGVAAGVGGKGVAAVDARTAGGGHRLQRPVGAELVVAVDAGIDAGRVDELRLVEGLVQRGPGDVGARRPALDAVAADQAAVAVVVQMPHVILRDAPLAAADRSLLLPALVGLAEPLAEVRTVDPVVESAEKTVRVVLGVPLGIPVVGDERFLLALEAPLLRPAEPELAALADEDAALNKCEGPRQDQLVDEDGPLVHPAGACRVFEDGDGADRILLAGSVDGRHVARHLADPEPAVGVERHRDRVMHERFGGDEFDPVAGGELERGKRLLRLEERGGGDRELLEKLVAGVPLVLLRLAGRLAVDRDSIARTENTAKPRRRTVRTGADMAILDRRAGRYETE